MTKDDLKKRLNAMPPSEMRQILEDIVCGLFTGRAIGTSDEIYEGVCSTLKEHGLDDDGEWEPEDDEEDDPLEKVFLELKTCLEDYQSQGCKVTKKSIKEYVREVHAMSKDLPREIQKELESCLKGIFCR